MNLSGRLQHGSIIWTDYQEKGKGQQGNVWLSERGKNLLFTLCLTSNLPPIRKQYSLNLISSLALYEVLHSLLPSSKVEIKWPNDIFVNDGKIAGILIETVISSGKLDQVYCGIGLNVNQSHFNLPSATSLKIVSGGVLERDAILEDFLLAFEKVFGIWRSTPSQLIQKYTTHLRWLGELRTYKISEGRINGIISGIDDQGKLLVQCGNTTKSFDVKEIEFLY